MSTLEVRQVHQNSRSQSKIGRIRPELSASKQWKQANPDKSGNIRDHADGLELLILSNLEAINTYLLKWDTDQEQRFKLLGEIAQHQREILPESQAAKRLIKKTRR